MSITAFPVLVRILPDRGTFKTSLGSTATLQLGALMNTRGLMELIALNVGYDIGVLSQRIFIMLVIMALVTTVMTGPLVTLFGKRAMLAERNRTETNADHA